MKQETRRARLERLFRPRSIAIVGLSDSSAKRMEALEPTFRSGLEVFIVNPLYERVAGRPAARSLTALDRPIDCVYSVMAAGRSVELAEEAAGLDIGGLMVMAAGFAEAGPAGVALQARLSVAAERGGFAVLGPNCLGFENVPQGIRLTGAVKEDHRAGGISIVSQSGAVVSGITMAGRAAGCGFNLLISSGNEAATDLADFVDYLVEDPATRSIGLVFEKIRRPEQFFAAAARALAAGKPIVAAKLGRTERTQRLAASHTGALTGDAWVYDVALRQHGIALARDPEELADRLSLVDQVPPERWTEVRSLGVVALSGGFASWSYDIAVEEGLPVPALDDWLPWVQERIPSALVANPLDPTGLGTQHWHDIMERYIRAPELDAVLVTEPMTVEGDSVRSRVMDIAAAAAGVSKPVVFANTSGLPPDWTGTYGAGAFALGRGIRPSLRGLQTLGSFVRHQQGRRQRPGAPPPLPRPPTGAVVTAAGEMLPFAATMSVLAAAGIPTAPFALVAADEDAGAAEIAFPGPYVAKLADVPHRTEVGAVRLDVRPGGLAAAVGELRAIARVHGLPALVAVQPLLKVEGEALIGVEASSELGPAIVLGLGGVFAEAVRRTGGRLAPIDLQEARDLIDEFRDVGVMHGFRGRPAWDLEALARILVAAGRLAAAGRGWIQSLDLNPIVFGPGGYAAVDALLLTRST